MPLIDDTPFPDADYRSIDQPESRLDDNLMELPDRKRPSSFLRKALVLWFGGTLITGTTLYTAISGWTGKKQPTVANVQKFSSLEWEASFEAYYEKFDKYQEYAKDSLEYQTRFAVYKSNMKQIDAHNFQAKNSRKADELTLGANQFTDLTFSEFKRRHLNAPDFSLLESPLPLISDDFLNYGVPREYPMTYNWEERGCVTSVKNQAKCGSCWAFSTTGAVEGALCAQRPSIDDAPALVSLSEQELVDCAGEVGERGCNGGLMDRGIQYVVNNKGLCSEEEYPYEAVQQQCRRAECPRRFGSSIKGFMRVKHHSEEALVQAINEYGPVSAGVQADKAVFQHYSTGILDLPCGRHLNHAILVVGYTQDYWLVKNSWGQTWGDDGYIKLARNAKRHHHKDVGECGVLLSAVVALVDRQPETPQVEPTPLD